VGSTNFAVEEIAKNNALEILGKLEVHDHKDVTTRPRKMITLL
jgi:hypothetical protein